MDTLAQMRLALQSDLNVNGNLDGPNTLFDTPTCNLALNRAYRKCAGFFKWPGTRDALKTSTIATNEYYDYPQNWRNDSIWKIRVDGSDMGDPTAYKDYLFEQDNNFPAGNKTLWSNQNARYFLTINGLPPQADGDNNIEIWGLVWPPQMVNDNDTTIFSFDMPECNEAVIMEALAILRIKGGEQPVRLLRYVQGALLLSMEAQQVLTNAWTKITQEEAKMDKTTPFFTVQDMFPTGINRVNTAKYNIGNF